VKLRNARLAYESQKSQVQDPTSRTLNRRTRRSRSGGLKNQPTWFGRPILTKVATNFYPVDRVNTDTGFGDLIFHEARNAAKRQRREFRA
jgi:hypothetical protein